MVKGKITVLGLGPGGLGLIPQQNLETLKKARRILVRTARHPAVEDLAALGIRFESCDAFYEEYDSFEGVYGAIVDKLLEEALQGQDLVYAVPGHPLVAESTVFLLKKKAAEQGIEIEILPAMSCLDAIYASLGIDPTAGIMVKDALELKAEEILPQVDLLITQLYSRQIASDVKLTLMEVYPDEYQVTLIKAAGIPEQEWKQAIPLYELDRLEPIDHLTSLYVPKLPQGQGKSQYPLDPLVKVMQQLLGEKGCPWDKEQTHDSLKRYLIEECYEVIEAIEERDMYKFCNELGDLLLQIVFHAQLAENSGSFNVNDVIQGITEKMIRRHPHVFGTVEVNDAQEVLVNWEKIKGKEKAASGQETLMDIPRGLPALYRAEKVQKRAAKVGFDWPDLKGPWEKLAEELAELKRAVEGKEQAAIAAEMGDVLFAAVNVARFLGVDPEEALHQTVSKFIRRFQYMERKAKEEERELSSMSLEELDQLWEKAKKEL